METTKRWFDSSTRPHADPSEIKGKSFAILSLILLIGGICGTAEAAKSVFIISSHDDKLAEAFRIEGDGVSFQAMVDITTYNQGIGPVGIAVWPQKGLAFFTYESSPMIVWSSTNTLKKVSEFNTGVMNLAGIVVDTTKQKIYVVKRGTANLYVYSWDVAQGTIVLDGSHILGGGLTGAFGLALDGGNDRLYVSNNSKTARYYDTNTWAYLGSIDIAVGGVDRPAVGIAVDPAQNYLYTGNFNGGTGSHTKLVRTSTSDYTSIETDIGYPVIGIDVDKSTGLVYCTTHAYYASYTSDFRVYDSDLTLLDIERNSNIESPAGVSVGGYFGGCNLEKTDDVGDSNCVTPGDEITYRIDYNYPAGSNVSDINDVNIIDYLPAEVEFLSASGGGIYDSDYHTVTWSIGNVSPGESGSFTVTVVVTGSQPGSIITNRCEIRSSDQILYTVYEYTSVCSPSLTKVDDVNECIDPCDNITYTICYDANGCSFTDVNIVDTLPPEVDYVSSEPTGEYDGISHTVTWDIGTLGPNDVCCVTVTVAATSPQTGSIITNFCEITSGSQILDTAYEYTYVCPWPTLTKFDNITGCVGPGDSITYTICYDPNGRNDANLVITDVLPVEVDFKSASDGGTYDSDSGSRMVTWLIGSIDPNDPNELCVTLTVEVNCAEPGSIITNSCEIKSGDQIFCTAHEYTAVCPGPTLTKVDNIPDSIEKIPAGSIFTYTICYDSNGYGGTDVYIVDPLPAEVNYISSVPDGEYDDVSHTVTWHIGTLGPNDVCCVTLQVKIKNDAPGGTITNCCEVTDYCIDINACENTKYFGISVVAINPHPGNGFPDVNFWPTLAWTPGTYVQEANGHQVYFGTSQDDVNNATTTTPVIYRGEVDVNRYDPYEDFGAPLLFNTTYYWRIDEVNDACDASPWKGDVWSFTTANYVVVEDFNPYTDINALVSVWEPNNDSGAAVELETVTVRSGKSMKYEYHDIGYHNWYSEVEANTLNLPNRIGQNWTFGGVEALTLYFYGDPNNDVNEPMYVRLADDDGDATVTYGDYGEDTNDVKKPEWHEWNIALTDFAGVDHNNIKQITIGFGNKDGPEVEGTVYFDDIRLYAPRCIPEYAGDLTGDCVVDYWDLKVMTDEWLDTNNCFTADIYRDCKIDFKDFAALANSWLAEGQMWPAE
jgi:uncharacterized repeat protein (TIGR01451 family)